MTPVQHLNALLARPEPLLALAPMQDVTDLPFWRLMTAYGGADVYYTEYFRVHADSKLEKGIVPSIAENPTGMPAVAQMIGNDIPSLVRTAKELQQYPIAAVDLNLGCPAPVVYKKCAGGGLLREPERIDAILGALRDAVQVKFTVKTRIGFDDNAVFDRLLPIFAKHSIDLLTVHGRTVLEMYRSDVHYDFIARAVQAMSCPVLANGNVSSAKKAEQILQETGARGLMIGRGAIRNPWMFQQIRQHQHGEPILLPRGRDVLAYIHALYDAVTSPEVPETLQVQKMKKYLNFLGLGVEPSGAFLHAMRRVKTKAELFALCAEHLDHGDEMSLEPFELDLQAKDVLAGVHQ
ncbi:tRNA-U20a,U20b-dihydrouridine synthase [Roseimicrobium gellanilyticum]|uniref:tRNA-dihydrouridine synthase n=1 Tax=Roseimicrobium gellanilyticum TaxID=748857 RepID=A0A366HTE2_9BACT|nr:tRNA-dihydrouridine synthase family protein [Roseimicrobium gellanilyticum]RBP47556.1 tRNA-U20a,U20b-dihydrouridine synthase [Roseimicrobium gellanilyticum]